MKQVYRTVAFACFIAGIVSPAARADLVATYTFNDSLNAQESGVAPLVAVDPLGTSGFQNATVFGALRNTWNFTGAASPVLDQGGLLLDTTGLIPANDYSLELVFELTGNSGWRRLVDSLDRTSDAGFYIDPNHNLSFYPDGGTSAPFAANTFYDVFVTVDSSDVVTGYFSGVQQFSRTSASMDIRTNFLGFFLDNTAGGGQGEWSGGNVALIKVFNSALTAQQVAAETEDPFQGTAPEPASWMLMLAGAAVILKRRG
jgi:hypothetical protein